MAPPIGLWPLPSTRASSTSADSRLDPTTWAPRFTLPSWQLPIGCCRISIPTRPRWSPLPTPRSCNCSNPSCTARRPSSWTMPLASCRWMIASTCPPARVNIPAASRTKSERPADCSGSRSSRPSWARPTATRPIWCAPAWPAFCARDRVAIRKFFETFVGVSLEQEDEAFADAAFKFFPRERDNLREIERRHEQLPGRPALPDRLSKLGKSLEDCCRERPVQKIVLELKRHLDALRDGMEQLRIFKSELNRSEE